MTLSKQTCNPPALNQWSSYLAVLCHSSSPTVKNEDINVLTPSTEVNITFLSSAFVRHRCEIFFAGDRDLVLRAIIIDNRDRSVCL